MTAPPVTRTLAAIDRALHFDTATPDGPGWQPGDALYPRPQCTTRCHDLQAACTCPDDPDAEAFCPHNCGHQVVRRMVEDRPTGPHQIRPRGYQDRTCSPCDVAWAGTDTCWNCGGPSDQLEDDLPQRTALVDDYTNRVEGRPVAPRIDFDLEVI